MCTNDDMHVCFVDAGLLGGNGALVVATGCRCDGGVTIFMLCYFANMHILWFAKLAYYVLIYAYSFI